jgi:hypothetical protein
MAHGSWNAPSMALASGLETPLRRFGEWLCMFGVSILIHIGTTQAESEEPLTNIDTRQIYKTSG